MTRQEKWNDSAIQKVINDGVKAAKNEIRSQVHGAKVRNGKIMALKIRQMEARFRYRKYDGRPVIIPQVLSDFIVQKWRNAMADTALGGVRTMPSMMGAGDTATWETHGNRGVV